MWEKSNAYRHQNMTRILAVYCELCNTLVCLGLLGAGSDI